MSGYTELKSSKDYLKVLNILYLQLFEAIIQVFNNFLNILVVFKPATGKHH
jgi:hypothetical protein